MTGGKHTALMPVVPMTLACKGEALSIFPGSLTRWQLGLKPTSSRPIILAPGTDAEKRTLRVLSQPRSGYHRQSDPITVLLLVDPEFVAGWCVEAA